MRHAWKNAVCDSTVASLYVRRQNNRITFLVVMKVRKQNRGSWCKMRRYTREGLMMRLIKEKTHANIEQAQNRAEHKVAQYTTLYVTKVNKVIIGLLSSP